MLKAKTTAARLWVLLFTCTVAFFYTRVEARAQSANERNEQASEVRIHFAVDQFEVKANVLNNAKSLVSLDSLANLCKDNGGSQLEIVSFSSPEGNALYNQYLSEKRGAALRNYIVKKHPALRGNISVLPYGESWDDLRELVATSAKLDDQSRAQILEVIDSEMDSDEKEASLKSLAAYNHIARNFFRSFRYARVRFAGAGAFEAAQLEPVVSAEPRLKVLFSEKATSFESSYAENPSVLKAIDELLTGANADRITALNIVSASSPDGPSAENKFYARRRGESFSNYIAEKYPDFAGKIVLQSKGEDWAEFRNEVLASRRLSDVQKRELLQIIDNPVMSEDAKEDELRSLDSWRTVSRYLVPQSRYAELVPVYPDTTDTHAPALDTIVPAPARDTIAPARDTLVREEPEPVVTPVEIPVAPVDTVVPAPVIEVPVDTVATPVDTAAPALTDVQVYENYTKVPTPLFAVSTNFLHEAATVFTGFHTVPLNIGIELPLNPHWSLTANYTATAPWHAWNNNADCVELLHADLGARWYPGGSFASPFKPKADRELLDGWYAYASIGAGYYDFERNGRGYQGEEILGALGIGYGLTLGSNWSFDFALGGGPLVTRYRYYMGRSNNEHLVYQYSGRLTYFGLTDAKVSLRYLIHYNKKVKVQ